MMEIVLLDDMVATHLTSWARIANTTGHDQIKPGDEFKEVGALEKFSIEAVSFSPVPGASRIRLLRAHHSTKPEVHKAGSVFLQTNIPVTAATNGGSVAPVGLTAPSTETTAVTVSNALPNGTVGLAEPNDIPDTIVAGGTTYANPAKRGRGRPPGAKNKPKQIPDWPSV